MRQFQLLAVVFGGTLAVLLVAFLLIAQLAGGRTTAVASPSPSVVAVETSTPSPPTARPPTSQPSRSIGPVPSPTHDPTPSPEPAATVAPGRTPKPTQPLATSPASVQVTVLGAAYIRRSGPSDARVTITSGRGVILETNPDTATPLTLTYELPLSRVPSGMKVIRLDAAVCGQASGDFWETYGPIWAEPIEFEVTQPGPDGCWHYIGIQHELGTTMAETAVTAGVRMASRFQVDRVVYTLIAR